MHRLSVVPSSDLFASFLAFKGTKQFFEELDSHWLDDIQEFIRRDLLKLLVTAIGAWLLVRLLGIVTRRMVLLAERHSSETARLRQVRTLASVCRATGIGLIGFLAALEILPLLGFKLEPLLASAGVAGVALGLAAQTIVKDCLNGMLILIEDQYNVGDKVRIGGVAGTVENMSLRKTLVRDDDGTLYVIPNSQITIVANITRDFSVSTITVSVDFTADPNRVLSLLREIAMGVCTDPEYSGVFLSDPVLLGVDAIRGSQVDYPVQFRTLANQQWAARREFQRRVRLALESEGLLPGDPLRVMPRLDGRTAGAPLQIPVDGGSGVVDPTAAKARETNPFTGEMN